jgi:hypothetical protein
MDLSLEAMTTIVERNKKLFPDKSPLVDMSLETAKIVVDNYMERKGDGYEDMTAIEFQAAVMIQELAGFWEAFASRVDKLRR